MSIGPETSQGSVLIAGFDESMRRFRIPVGSKPITIGRATDADICLWTDAKVSRYHCRVFLEANQLWIEDLNSTNGTLLNNERVAGRVAALVPSSLTVGDTQLGLIRNDTAEGWARVGGDVATTVQPGRDAVPQTSSLRVQEAAVCVIDMVGSTILVTRDETLFAKAIIALEQLLTGELVIEADPFIQNSGDGFVVCFSDANHALTAAVQLGVRLRQLFGPFLQFSVALHWGSFQGGADLRVGGNMHGVFALEKLRHAIPSLEEEFRGENLAQLTLLTEAFWERLSPELQAGAVPLGTFPLKGLAEPVRVRRWIGVNAAWS